MKIYLSRIVIFAFFLVGISLENRLVAMEKKEAVLDCDDVSFAIRNLCADFGAEPVVTVGCGMECFPLVRELSEELRVKLVTPFSLCAKRIYHIAEPPKSLPLSALSAVVGATEGDVGTPVRPVKRVSLLSPDIHDSPVRLVSSTAVGRTPVRNEDFYLSTSQLLREYLIENILQLHNRSHVSNRFFKALLPVIDVMFFPMHQENECKRAIAIMRGASAKKEDKKVASKSDLKQKDPRNEFDGFVKKLNKTGSIHDLLCNLIFESRKSVCDFLQQVGTLHSTTVEELKRVTATLEGKEAIGPKKKSKVGLYNDVLDKNIALFMDTYLMERLREVIASEPMVERIKVLDVMRTNAETAAAKIIEDSKIEAPSKIEEARKNAEKTLKDAREMAPKLVEQAATRAKKMEEAAQAKVTRIREATSKKVRDAELKVEESRKSAIDPEDQNLKNALQIFERETLAAAAEVKVAEEGIINAQKTGRLAIEQAEARAREMLEQAPKNAAKMIEDAEKIEAKALERARELLEDTEQDVAALDKVIRSLPEVIADTGMKTRLISQEGLLSIMQLYATVLQKKDGQNSFFDGFRFFIKKICVAFEDDLLNSADIKEFLSFIFEYYSWQKFYANHSWLFDSQQYQEGKKAILSILHSCQATRLAHASEMYKPHDIGDNFRRLITAILERDSFDVGLLHHCIQVQMPHLEEMKSVDRQRELAARAYDQLLDTRKHMVFQKSWLYGQDFDFLVRHGIALEKLLQLKKSECLFDDAIIIRDRHICHLAYDREFEDDVKSVLSVNGGHFSQDTFPYDLYVPAGLMNDPRALYNHRVIGCIDITQDEIARMHDVKKPRKSTDNALHYVVWHIQKDEKYQGNIDSMSDVPVELWTKESTLFPTCFKRNFGAYAGALCKFTERARIVNSPVIIRNPLGVLSITLKEVRESGNAKTSVYTITHPHLYGCIDERCVYAKNNGTISVTMYIRKEVLSPDHTLSTILSMYPEL